MLYVLYGGLEREVVNPSQFAQAIDKAEGNVQPQDYLTDIKESGGNSIRVWLFVEGDAIPLWDEGTGLVVGTDSADTLIDELDRFDRRTSH